MNAVSIGNDIVDLQANEPQLHQRFLSRVFSASEQAEINQDLSKLWLYWSAKEAAYKAIKRLIPTTIFSPRKFEYIPEKQIIKFEDQTFYCAHQLSSEYVYTFCCDDYDLLKSGLIYNWIEKIPDISVAEHSKAVRALAIKEIAGILKTPRLTIPSSSKSYSLPRLLVDGQNNQSLLSFTHHGNYVACCFMQALQS